MNERLSFVMLYGFNVYELACYMLQSLGRAICNGHLRRWLR